MREYYIKFIIIALSLWGAWMPEVRARDYVPMINDGRLWEYCGYSAMYEGRAFHYMKFGDVLSINEKTYRQFHVVKSFVVDYNSESIITIDDCEQPVYYIRESESKVYALCLGENIVSNLDILARAEANPSETWDFIIYDFSLEENAVIKYPEYLGESGYLEPTVDLTVKWGDRVSVGSETVSVMKFEGVDDIEFVEGIGTTSNGCLGAPNIGRISGTADNTMSVGLQSWLNRVLGENGDMLYACKNFCLPPDEVNALPSIFFSRSASNDLVIDVTGCRVSRLIPGSVYIKNGKKFVAR